MGYQGFLKILMITQISSKNLGGYKIMKHTVPIPNFNFNNLLIIISGRIFCDKENNNFNITWARVDQN